MSCATAKKEGSSRYASSIRARSTRLAGSVRERAIAPNAAKSFSPIANSIACRHAVMSATLSANQSRKARTHVGKWESSPYDGFHGIDVLAQKLLARCCDAAGADDTTITWDEARKRVQGLPPAPKGATRGDRAAQIRAFE